MVSKLCELVSDIAEQNEIEIEKVDMPKIKLIEKHLNENGNIEDAMVALDSVLGYKWDKYYPQIKKQLERR